MTWWLSFHLISPSPNSRSLPKCVWQCCWWENGACVCVSVCVTSQKFENMFVVCQIFMNAHFIAGEWGVAQMSPSNDHASVAQWNGLRTLNPRTSKLQCVITCCSGSANITSIYFAISACVWQLAKPRTRKSFLFHELFRTFFAIWLLRFLLLIVLGLWSYLDRVVENS